MKTIFKYQLLVRDQEIEMPVGAQILCTQMQCGLQLWALVDDAKPSEIRKISVVGTGWNIDGNPGTYIGTVQDGMYVWHVFDATQVEMQSSPDPVRT